MECPANTRLTRSGPQHRSPEVSPSSRHDPYWRSTNPIVRSNPSPTHDGWLFDVEVRPSTDAELYANTTSGSGPTPADGTVIGYDHVNSPVPDPAFHAADAANGETANDPDGPEGPAVAASTTIDDPSTPDVVVRAAADAVNDATVAASTVALSCEAAAGLPNSTWRAAHPADTAAGSQSGNATNRARDPQSPPNPDANADASTTTSTVPAPARAANAAPSTATNTPDTPETADSF